MRSKGIDSEISNWIHSLADSEIDSEIDIGIDSDIDCEIDGEIAREIDCESFSPRAHHMYNHYYDRRRRYLRRDCHDGHLYHRGHHERRRVITITLTIAMSIPKTLRCKLLPVSWGRAPYPPRHVVCRIVLPRLAQLEAALRVLTKLPRWVRRA